MLLYCFAVVRCTVVLLYVVLLCCCTVVMYCCAVVLLYVVLFSVVLFCCCTVLLLCCFTVVLFYCCAVVLLCCFTVVLLCCCTVVLLYTVFQYRNHRCFLIQVCANRLVSSDQCAAEKSFHQQFTVLCCAAVSLCTGSTAVTPHSQPCRLHFILHIYCIVFQY